MASSCSKLRRAQCEDDANCEWVASKGCRARTRPPVVPTVTPQPRTLALRHEPTPTPTVVPPGLCASMPSQASCDSDFRCEWVEGRGCQEMRERNVNVAYASDANRDRADILLLCHGRKHKIHKADRFCVPIASANRCETLDIHDPIFQLKTDPHIKADITKKSNRLPRGKYSYVVSVNCPLYVFYDVFDQTTFTIKEDTFANIYRMLKPNGVFVFNHYYDFLNPRLCAGKSRRDCRKLISDAVKGLRQPDGGYLELISDAEYTALFRTLARNPALNIPEGRMQELIAMRKVVPRA